MKVRGYHIVRGMKYGTEREALEFIKQHLGSPLYRWRAFRNRHGTYRIGYKFNERLAYEIIGGY